MSMSELNFANQASNMRTRGGLPTASTNSVNLGRIEGERCTKALPVLLQKPLQDAGNLVRFLKTFPVCELKSLDPRKRRHRMQHDKAWVDNELDITQLGAIL